MIARRRYGDRLRTPQKEPAKFGEHVALILDTMNKLRKIMLSKNKRYVWTWCPREGCGGKLYATLNGPKNHMHAACNNKDCSVRWME